MAKEKLSERVAAKREARKVQADAFKKAKALGIDVAGMGFKAVQEAVEAAGDVQAPAGDESPVTVNLDKLKAGELKAIASFLEIDLEGVKNNEGRITAIKASGSWPEDPEAQAKIVEAIQG